MPSKTKKYWALAEFAVQPVGRTKTPPTGLLRVARTIADLEGDEKFLRGALGICYGNGVQRTELCALILTSDRGASEQHVRPNGFTHCR
ncbi:MAG: hypothetical protein JRH01_14565 [Deltaproteobacteria bacterium]|nr:hypothetical protein [Deltaproteobacteria bacterium]MBW2396960.1 hypothetical protein [Deltaproteobacteria bacterium]